MWVAELQNLKLRYDHRSGKCNLSKKFRGFNRIRTHGLCVCAAVLYHLSNEDPYIGSMPVCWVHLNTCEEWNMKMLWTEEIQILNDDMIITMVNAIYAWLQITPPKNCLSAVHIIFIFHSFHGLRWIAMNSTTFSCSVSSSLRSWRYCVVVEWDLTAEPSRAAKPREIPPAREPWFFECRPLLSP